MNKRIIRTITQAQAGMQTGKYLKNQVGLTPAQIRSVKFCRDGILINGQRARVTRVLNAGDVLELNMASREEDRGVFPKEGPLEILYEDEDVIALWKEAGVILHPAKGHFEDSLANRLCAYLEARDQHARARVIGRLDIDTSGVVVFAKNKIAASRLWKQREEGTFLKEYLAVCEKEFSPEEVGKEFTIRVPIKEEPGLHKMQAARDGLAAVTHYEVLDRHRIRLWLETGRTHQIRVHMAWAGHPLLGDALYGNGTKGKTHASLCAWKTEFLQPFTGERICISKPETGRERVI